MTTPQNTEIEVPDAVSEFIEQLAMKPDARLAKPAEDQSIDDIMAIHSARKQAVQAARLLRLALPKTGQFPEADLIRDLAALKLTEDEKPGRDAEAIEEIEENLGDDKLLNDCADFRELEARAYKIYRARLLSTFAAYPCKKLNRDISDLSNDDLFSIYCELKEVVEAAREIKAVEGDESDGPEGELVSFMAEQWIAADATEEDLDGYDDVDEFEDDLEEDRLFDAHGALEAIEAKLRGLLNPTTAPSI